MINKTISTKHKDIKAIKRGWHLVDLKNKILGREASNISFLLQGKNRSDYSPFLDTGDYVVAINAKYIKITGNKKNTKEYLSYSGYPGGLKTKSYKEMLANNPILIIKYAVNGMLPKNKLRKKRILRLFIFPDAEHNYGKEITNN